MKEKSIATAIAFALLVFTSSIAHAIVLTCPIPTTKRFYSSTKNYYLEVVPRKNTGDSAAGILYKLGADQQYHQIWSSHLSNKIAPERILVSNNGDYVVTLDNWCAAGRGDNVVVIYGSSGKLIKKFALRDVASKEEISKFHVTAEGTWWGGEHFLDEGSSEIILKIKTGGFNLVSDRKPSYYVGEYRDVRIKLDTGEIINLISSP